MIQCLDVYIYIYIFARNKSALWITIVSWGTFHSYWEFPFNFMFLPKLREFSIEWNWNSVISDF